MANNNDNKVLNVPHLRFPEFTEEWEEHALAEYLDFLIIRLCTCYIRNY